MFGLEPDIHGHKALAHDMHAESNALRQSFVPQPMLRSSWPQLVIPVLGTGIQKEMFGSRPNMTVRKKAEHDREKKAPQPRGLDLVAFELSSQFTDF